MSRVGKKNIIIPSGVACALEQGVFSVSKGTRRLDFFLPEGIEVFFSQKELTVKPILELNPLKGIWGTVRSILANMVKGVSEGFVTIVEMKGVGYRASVASGNLVLKVGFSKEVFLTIPNEIDVTVDKLMIRLSGIDCQKIGQFASQICRVRKTEPYKGSGIWIKGSYVVRKEGKKGRK